jgi:cytochrome c oxidase assembly protein subunit 15
VRAVRAWLILCCALIFIMVIVGGATRLTESGLSIVEWNPVMGAIPPLSHAEWQRAFDAYRETPEFKTYNFWMGLDDFRAIYWMEYGHRLLGRIIGVVFLLPLIWFAVRRQITERLAGQLAVAFLLGAAQGALGWYMVQSGLVDRPEVSHYRLAAHLGLAVAIYGWLLWILLGLYPRRREEPGRGFAVFLLCWVSVTMVWGAFTAGLDAGVMYATFPLMDGGLAPPGAFEREPFLINFVENKATVQFTHRWLAIGFVALALYFWFRVRTQPSAWLAAMALVQAGLGIATLLTGVEIAIAAAHQAGALIVFSLAVWGVHVKRGPSTAGAR